MMIGTRRGIIAGGAKTLSAAGIRGFRVNRTARTGLSIEVAKALRADAVPAEIISAAISWAKTRNSARRISRSTKGDP